MTTTQPAVFAVPMSPELEITMVSLNNTVAAGRAHRRGDAAPVLKPGTVIRDQDGRIFLQPAGSGLREREDRIEQRRYAEVTETPSAFTPL